MVVHLTRQELHSIIKESVDRLIKESSFFDGNHWYGCPRIKMEWCDEDGGWNDPELVANGHYIQYPFVEDFCKKAFESDGVDFND